MSKYNQFESFLIIFTLKKNLMALIGNLIDSTSVSVRKWMNQNSCRNYYMFDYFFPVKYTLLENLC